MCVHMHTGAWGWHYGFFLVALYLIHWDRVSQLKPKLTGIGWFHQPAYFRDSVSASQVLGLSAGHMPAWHLHGVWRSAIQVFSSHSSALSAEPSPQPYPVFYSRHFLPWGFHHLCQNWGWGPENLLHPNYFLMFLIVSYNHTKVIDLGSIWKLLSFLRGRNWHFPNQYLLLWPGCCSAYIFGRLKIIPHQEVLSTWPSPLLWRCAHSSNLHREQQIKWRDTAVRIISPSESKFSSIKADWEFPSCGSHGCRSATPLFSQSPSHHQSLKDKRVRDATVATRGSLPSPAF